MSPTKSKENTAMASDLLKVGDVGTYESQIAKSNPDKLSLVYIPALTLLLGRAADLFGRPLSDAEVDRIARGAEVTAMPENVANATIQSRGGIK
jgi:hypothetical protein